MHTSDIYHTQGIQGFHVRRTDYGSRVTVKLEFSPRSSHNCTTCGSTAVRVRELGVRNISGLPCGSKKVYFEVPVVRLDCDQCFSRAREELPFVDKYSRHTKAVERSIVELRREMSLKAVAGFLGLDWRTVKEVEKRHLKKKFRRIRLKGLKVIGIDEIHIGSDYRTIVRDLVSGAVLFVGNGKGGDALADFTGRLRRAQSNIKVVAMDMSAGYSGWVRKVLPKADIVFDHFHLIKLMNDKLEQLRRETMSQLDDDTRAELKRKRKLLVCNEENLDEEGQLKLTQIKETFEPLGTMHAMKEKLRSIYRTANHVYDAQLLFEEWIDAAKESGIPALKNMAKTIQRHLDGILGYWKYDALTSAGMEGFNNKIRWLIRQAYGFHDEQYFRLKIYDLPTCKTVKDI